MGGEDPPVRPTFLPLPASRREHLCPAFPRAVSPGLAQDRAPRSPPPAPALDAADGARARGRVLSGAPRGEPPSPPCSRSLLGCPSPSQRRAPLRGTKPCGALLAPGQRGEALGSLLRGCPDPSPPRRPRVALPRQRVDRSWVAEMPVPSQHFSLVGCKSQQAPVPTAEKAPGSSPPGNTVQEVLSVLRMEIFSLCPPFFFWGGGSWSHPVLPGAMAVVLEPLSSPRTQPTRILGYWKSGKPDASELQQFERRPRKYPEPEPQNHQHEEFWPRDS